jgi:hypothetical protein
MLDCGFFRRRGRSEDAGIVPEIGVRDPVGKGRSGQHGFSIQYNRQVLSRVDNERPLNRERVCLYQEVVRIPQVTRRTH